MKIGIVSLALVAALLTPCAVLAQSVSGTATVDYGTGEFEGYWCYTIEFTWDSPQSLSNLSNFLGLEDLVCACDAGLFAFDYPAGQTTGLDDNMMECMSDYSGEYVCTGNPSLPDELSSMAAVKWEPSPEICDPGLTGSGWVRFYSLLAPGVSNFHDDVLVLKSDSFTILGDVTGPLPAADCSVPDHKHTIGSMKARFDQ